MPIGSALKIWNAPMGLAMPAPLPKTMPKLPGTGGEILKRRAFSKGGNPQAELRSLVEGVDKYFKERGQIVKRDVKTLQKFYYPIIEDFLLRSETPNEKRYRKEGFLPVPMVSVKPKEKEVIPPEEEVEPFPRERLIPPEVLREKREEVRPYQPRLFKTPEGLTTIPPLILPPPPEEKRGKRAGISEELIPPEVAGAREPLLKAEKPEEIPPKAEVIEPKLVQARTKALEGELTNIDKQMRILEREKALLTTKEISTREVDKRLANLSRRYEYTDSQIAELIIGEPRIEELKKEVAQMKIGEIIRGEVKAEKVGVRIGVAETRLQARETQIRKREIQVRKKEINRLLNQIQKVDTSEMSPAHEQPIRDVQDIVDYTKPTKKTLASLANTRNFLEANPDAELPDYVYDDLKRLERLNRDDMTTDLLESLAYTVSHHAHLEKRKKTIKIGRERRRATKVVENSISEMKPSSKVKSDIVSSQKSKIGKMAETGQLIKDTFGIRQDHYDLVIETLAGPNSTQDKVLYQEVKEGVNAQLAHKQDTYRQFQEDLDTKNFMERHGIKDIGTWLNETVAIGKYHLTRGERMALYRHSLNVNNLRHILEGGFGFKFSPTPYKVHTMTQGELNTILGSLNDAEKKFASDPTTRLFDRQHEALSRVFYEKNGYPLPKENNYYPIDVMKVTLPHELEVESILEEMKHKWVRIGLRKGMLENRKKSKLPIYLNNIAYDINRSVMNASAYVGLEIPLTNASKLLYNKQYKSEMFRKYGRQTWLEIDKGLRDIAGDWQSYTTTEKLALKAKNKLTTAILGISFAIPKQILSYALYSVYVRPQYLLQGYGDFISHPKEVQKRHKLYSPEYLERIEGGYSRDVADIFKTGAEKRLYKGKKGVSERVMGGVKFFDEKAVTPGMQGAVLQVLDELKTGELSPEVKVALDIKEADIPTLSAEDKMKLAYKYADWVTERTQPMFSPEHRSSLSKGTALEKLATQFSSFTNQALNLLRRTWRRAQDTGDPDMYGKFFKALFLLLVINTGGVMLIDEVRDRIFRREKRVKRGLGAKYGEAVLDSTASYFYFLRDIERSLVSKVQKGTFTGYDISLPILSFGNRFVNAFANGIAMFAERNPAKKKKLAGNFVDDALAVLLMSQGIPYDTPKKIITRGGKKKKSAMEVWAEPSRTEKEGTAAALNVWGK